MEVESVKTLGGEPKLLNTPQDAPSIFADGISGMGFSSSVVKINFWEQVTQPDRIGEIVAAYNLRLALPVEQFIKIARLFNRIADELEGAAPISGTIIADKEEK